MGASAILDACSGSQSPSAFRSSSRYSTVLRGPLSNIADPRHRTSSSASASFSVRRARRSRISPRLQPGSPPPDALYEALALAPLLALLIINLLFQQEVERRLAAGRHP